MLVGVLVAAVVIAFGLVLLQPAFTQYVDSYAIRVRPKREKALTGAQAAPKDSALLKLCQTLGELVLSVAPYAADKRSAVLLNQGGYRTREHLAIFVGIKAMVAGGSGAFAILMSAGKPMGMLSAGLIAFLAWMMPNFFLAGRVKKRQKQIVGELPTVLDLLIVCAQAGLGLLNCVDKVSKEVEDSCPVLAGEMQQTLNDVKIFAKSVPHALAEMGDRCGVDDLTNMANFLIAAEAKGADISYPLKQQSEAMRDKLKRKKEEEASKVPVKMVPVIMVFIMPLILCPMLGPAAITIMTSFGGAFGK